MPVRSMVCSGLMRPSAGYLLFAPCGPWLSKLSASEITLPLRTRRAAATMSSAVVWFSVPISSFGPQRPQFLYFSAALRRSSRVSLRSVMVWRSARGKRIAYQAAALGGALLVAWFLISNTMTNLEERRIASGFGFLGREAGFEIGESAFLRYGAADSYLRALVVGLTNTLAVAVIGIVLATVLGTAIGLARLSKNFLLRTLSAAYVEFVRNVPLLVQLFFWYAVITEGMPHAREALSPLPGVFLSNRGIFFPTLSSVPELQGFNFVGGAALTPGVRRAADRAHGLHRGLHRRDRARRHPRGGPRAGRGGARARPVARRRPRASSCCRRRCASSCRR